MVSFLLTSLILPAEMPPVSSEGRNGKGVMPRARDLLDLIVGSYSESAKAAKRRRRRRMVRKATIPAITRIMAPLD